MRPKQQQQGQEALYVFTVGLHVHWKRERARQAEDKNVVDDVGRYIKPTNNATARRVGC